MSTARDIAERTTTDFEAWWAFDGRFIDPDTSDVPWFDKRKELAALAFIEARKPVASTEPLGDDLLRAIIYEPGYSVPYDLALRMASDIEKKAAEIADLQAQLKTAQCSAGDRLRQIRQIAKQSADLRAQLQAAQQRIADECENVLAAVTAAKDAEIMLESVQQLADERGREVERLSAALDEMHEKRNGSPNEFYSMFDRLWKSLAATPPAHVYTSTACQHGLHDRCRKACKFCGTPCLCPCGHFGDGRPAKPKDPEIFSDYNFGDENRTDKESLPLQPPAQEHPDTACPACNGILAQGWRCWTCGRTGPISVACIAPEAQR